MAHAWRKSPSVDARERSAYPPAPPVVLFFLMSFALPAPVLGQVVGNPGPVVLTVERLDVEYDRGTRPGPSTVGFRFDAHALPQCSDGRNNDDHRSAGQGMQDAAIDYPADPECESIDDDSEDKRGHQARAEIVLAGWVDADGNLEFPAEGVRLPPRYHRSEERALGGDGVVINTFVPARNIRGHVDPARGTMDLELALRLRFQVENTGRLSGPGDHCYIGSRKNPQALKLIADRREDLMGVHPGRARGYYPEDGLVVLAGTNPGKLPGAGCCGLLCFGDGAVDHAFGTPAEPGSATVTVIGRLSPPPRAPEASPVERLASSAARTEPGARAGVAVGRP